MKSFEERKTRIFLRVEEKKQKKKARQKRWLCVGLACCAAFLSVALVDRFWPGGEIAGPKSKERIKTVIFQDEERYWLDIGTGSVETKRINDGLDWNQLGYSSDEDQELIDTQKIVFRSGFDEIEEFSYDSSLYDSAGQKIYDVYKLATEDKECLVTVRTDDEEIILYQNYPNGYQQMETELTEQEALQCSREFLLKTNRLTENQLNEYCIQTTKFTDLADEQPIAYLCYGQRIVNGYPTEDEFTILVACDRSILRFEGLNIGFLDGLEVYLTDEVLEKAKTKLLEKLNKYRVSLDDIQSFCITIDGKKDVYLTVNVQGAAEFELCYRLFSVRE